MPTLAAAATVRPFFLPESEPRRRRSAGTSRRASGGRLVFLAAAAMTLAGCVGGDDELSALQLSAPADDAHCRSLLMQPGELVYAQCRLAMRRTYLDDYAKRKAAIEAAYGPVGSELDLALRNDTFCNYDESVKASVQPVDGAIAADQAYGNCGTTRTELAQAFSRSYAASPDDFIASQQSMVAQQNVASVAEARSVIGGPPTDSEAGA